MTKLSLSGWSPHPHCCLCVSLFLWPWTYWLHSFTAQHPALSVPGSLFTPSSLNITLPPHAQYAMYMEKKKKANPHLALNFSDFSLKIFKLLKIPLFMVMLSGVGILLFGSFILSYLLLLPFRVCSEDQEEGHPLGTCSILGAVPNPLHPNLHPNKISVESYARSSFWSVAPPGLPLSSLNEMPWALELKKGDLQVAISVLWLLVE